MGCDKEILIEGFKVLHVYYTKVHSTICVKILKNNFRMKTQVAVTKIDIINLSSDWLPCSVTHFKKQFCLKGSLSIHH